MTDEIVIRTANLSKRYGQRTAPAVQRASIEIKRGEIYGIIGENGAGKTTLFRMLMGLAVPTEGSVEIFGAGDPASLAAARRRIGSVVEGPALYPGMSAKQNLLNHALLRDIPRAERKDRIEAALNADGFPAFLHRKPGNRHIIAV